MNYILLLAGGVSAFALVLHIMLGRKRSLHEPLSTPENEAALKADAWFGRFLQMGLLACMALVYSDASRQLDARDVVFWVSILGLLATLLRLGLGVHAAARRYDIHEWGWMGLGSLLGLGGLYF